MAKKKRTGKKWEYIEAVAERAGWDIDKAEAVMTEAKEKYGIKYGDYANNGFETMTEEEQQEKAAEIIRKRELREARLNTIMEGTGWTREEAADAMKKAKADFNISNKDYVRFKLYLEEADNLGEILADKKEKRAKRIALREARLERIQEETGWTREEAADALSYAWTENSITNADYMVFKLYQVSREEQLDTLIRLKEEKEERIKEKEERRARMREKHIQTVMGETGWEYEHTAALMDHCFEDYGMSYEYYVKYRFWEVDDEAQATYFTKGHADHMKVKYNYDRKATQTMMSKPAFCEAFAEYTGRASISNKEMELEDFERLFAAGGKVIYKPDNAQAGRGVEIYDFDEDSVEETFDTLSELPDGIIESYLKQHPEMQKLSLRAVNTVRVVTIFTKRDDLGIEPDKVHTLYAAVRMGGGMSPADNLHRGGFVAVIDEKTGEFISDAIDVDCNVYEAHPDTGTVIKGFQVPMYDQVRELIETIGTKYEGYYGWDIAITENGPVVVEGNTHPDSFLLQGVYAPEKKGMKYVVEKFL